MTIHNKNIQRPAHRNGTRVAAVLGPTNTGKTHFAIERMLAHRSGMIGLPLRLLAREVYDKIVRLKGERVCALITGEQKIVPPNAAYFVCTVEAMPLDLNVAFLAVDEIQLCADPARGHVFTDRLLHARGEEETLFMGAETMRGIIQRFVPGAEFITRPRFSDLAYTGTKKLTRLPRRSAIVGFSAEDVYGIADLVRRQRGGAAVVLGALSPRTRNAQVELYQSGDVDFLVATDAIGMGLNMDVDHVAFAACEKFDGVGVRPLRPDEIGQIAGRAGRHMNDGTFGVTGDAEPFEDEIALRVETHRYDPTRVVQWRNSALQYHSLPALLKSLDEPPPHRGLAKARPSSDVISLRTLAANDDIANIAHAPAAVRRLWDACQIPDFRKLTSDEHTKLVDQIYRYLMSDAGVLPEDWFARQIARLDNIEGDVATLSGRLAQIRTWTYAANRSGWLKDSGHWQEQTRAVEDRLSDALHEELTQRFIDRRTSILMRGLRDDEILNVTFDDAGTVGIGGETLGKLEGLRFTPDPRAEGIHGRTLRAAALKGLEAELSSRVTRLGNADDKEITLSEHGRLWWDGAIVGQLVAGPQALSPRVSIAADENLRAELHQCAQQKLDDWLARRVASRLEPLIALRNAADAKPGSAHALPADARGLAHQLCENFGTLHRKDAAMPEDERAAMRSLRPFGVMFARRTIYLPKLLRPEAAQLLGLLWAVHEKCEQIPPPPAPGLTSFDRDDSQPDGFLHAAGFHAVGPRAIRVDMLDRLERELEETAKTGTTAQAALPLLVSLLGCDRSTLETILEMLGWTQIKVANPAGETYVWRKAARAAGPSRGKKAKVIPADKARAPQIRPDSPFAGLAQLLGGK
ncbi:MAG TPA: helicase-related protein [Rhizomicrobium sp.]|nr:helicase-related protein [Rhizomicrobium sp.]